MLTFTSLPTFLAPVANPVDGLISFGLVDRSRNLLLRAFRHFHLHTFRWLIILVCLS
jgi:hypothetical protein